MTPEELEKLYQEGKATLPINHINHREFVYNGMRYFCGWDSTKDLTYKPTEVGDPAYKVRGWILYKQEPESK